jgi:hypothetical protein
VWALLSPALSLQSFVGFMMEGLGFGISGLGFEFGILGTWDLGIWGFGV